MKKLLFIIFLLFCSQAWATTWYTRDGGGNTSQCTGKTNAVYPGSGVNQNCAFSNPGYALGWNCQNGGGSCANAGVVSSGDTLSILGDSDVNSGQQAQYQVGYSSPQMPTCSSGGASDCTMGQIPTGVTIIGTGIHQPQIFAPSFPWEVFSVFSNNVTFQNLELTTHETCGYNSPDTQCSNGEGSNRTSDGILMSGSGYTLNNVWIHGFSRFGIVTGSVSGTNTFTNIKLIGNGYGGFTLGNGDSSTNTGTLVFNQPIVEWNGCLESYPLTSGIDGPADHKKCYGQTFNGYGDGIAFGPSGNTNAGSWTIKGPGSISFNMQDGLDTLHGQGTGTIQIDKMRFEGNAGNQVKINAQTGIVTNSLIIGDCGWWWGGSNLSSSYNSSNILGDICRALGNTISYFTTSGSGTTDTFYNNTIMGNGNIQLLQNNTCNSTDVLTVKNNIIYGGYDWGDDTSFNGSGGNSQIHFYYAAGTDGNGTGCSGQTITEDYNIMYGNSGPNTGCNGTHDKCGTLPGFVTSLPMGISGGAQNTYYSGTQAITYAPISNGSAAVGAGVNSLSFWNNSNDYYNVTRTSPPAIGGLELSSCAASSYGCFYNSDCCGGSCVSNMCGGSCSSNGSSCSTGVTCCSTLCSLSVCVACISNGNSCSSGGSCCSGFCCSNSCSATTCGGGTNTGPSYCVIGGNSQVTGTW